MLIHILVASNCIEGSGPDIQRLLKRKFQMLGHARNAQAHAGVGAEADPHTGVMDSLQVLLIGRNGRSVYA
jgi:hypothetical protein